MGDLDQHRGPGEGFAAEGAKQIAALEAEGTLKTPVEAIAMAQLAYSLVCQDRAIWQARAMRLQRERDMLLDVIAGHVVASTEDAKDTEDSTRVDDRDSARGQELPQRDGKG